MRCRLRPFLLLLARLRVLAPDPRQAQEGRDARRHHEPPPVEPSVPRPDLADGHGLLGSPVIHRTTRHRLVAQAEERGVGALREDDLAVALLDAPDKRHHLRAAARLGRRGRHRLDDCGLHVLLTEGRDPLRVGGKLATGLGDRREEGVEAEEEKGRNRSPHEQLAGRHVVVLAEVHPEHFDVLHRLDARRTAHPAVHEPRDQGQEQARDSDVPRVLRVVHHAVDDRVDHREAVDEAHQAEAPREAILQPELRALALVRHEGTDERLRPVDREVAEDPGEERDADRDQSRPHVPPREVVVRANRAQDRDRNGRDPEHEGIDENDSAPFRIPVAGLLVGVAGADAGADLARLATPDQEPDERAHHPGEAARHDREHHEARVVGERHGAEDHRNGGEDQTGHEDQALGHALRVVLSAVGGPLRLLPDEGGGGEGAVDALFERLLAGTAGSGCGPRRGRVGCMRIRHGASFRFGVSVVRDVHALHRVFRGVELALHVACGLLGLGSDLVGSCPDVIGRGFGLPARRFLQGTEVALDEDEQRKRHPAVARLQLFQLQVGHEPDSKL